MLEVTLCKIFKRFHITKQIIKNIKWYSRQNFNETI
jgi:hypothetical protein